MDYSDPATLFLIGSILIIPISLVIIIVVKSGRQATTGEESLLADGDDGSGELEGVTYHYRYHPGGKNSSSSFNVSIDIATPCKLSVTKESGFHRFFKNLGLAMEVQTGDRSFDADYYIDCDVPTYAQSYLSNSDRRAAAREVIEAGYNQVTLEEEKCEASVSPAIRDELASKEKLEKVVAALIRLTSGSLPSVPPSMIEKTARELRKRRSLIFGPLIILLLAGITSLVAGLTLYSPLDPGTIFLDSILYIGAGIVLFMMLAVSQLRGSSSAGTEIVIAAVLGLITAILLGWGGQAWVNGFFDPAKSDWHEALVLSKRISRSKDSTTYYISVQSWRPGEAIEELSVSSFLYYEVKPSKTIMAIETKPGRLGYEWVVGYGVSSR